MDRFLPLETDPKQLSPLDLAFLGDCVYELFVREQLVSEANRPNRDLHAAKVKLVNAEAQEAAIKALLPLLTEEEQAVFRRGRNAHTHHTPKNMSSASYHAATGFEALFGYLYLKGELDRLREFFGLIYNGQERTSSI
ncbi:MAG: ribonuclease III [Clostridia bacterium]|nr:ribonuclease III [Clostridia bacterium]